MTVYRLTRDSVAQAATAGNGSGSDHGILRSIFAAGIPENVHAALNQWAKGLKRTGKEELLRFTGAAPKDKTERGL